MRARSPVLVSVVIPAFNAARHLPEALASVLIQGVRPLEILVVDDASGDGTAEIAACHADRGVRLIRHGRQAGIGAARNSGIAAAEGRYLAFLDADDRWPARRLEMLLAALGDRQTPDMAFGHCREFLSPDFAGRETPRLAGAAFAAYCAGAMLLRLADFRRIGPFEEDLKLGEFIDWFARARDGGLSHAMLGDVVLERRIHGANQTIRHRADYADYLRVLKRSLDRRRAVEAEAPAA